MITSSSILDIIEIVYFAPALLLTICVCIRHGFRKESGWFFLTMLCLVRTAGAATSIAAWKEPNNSGLLIASLIMSSIGSAMLVAALTGIVNRIDTGTGASSLPPKIRKYLQIMGLIAMIMGIVGGTRIADSDPDTRASGADYIEAAIILVFVQFLVTVTILILSARKLRYIWEGDRILFFVVAACVPFVFIRLIYSTCAAFNLTSPVWGLRSGTTVAVALRAVLGIAMEIIAVSLLIYGGIKAPKMRKGEAIMGDSSSVEDKELPEQHQMSGITGQTARSQERA